MNATERLVELYYRNALKCFTVTDVKVQQGNNKQLDMLAFRPLSGEAFHIEVSVSHRPQWQPAQETLLRLFRSKFAGQYRESILATYQQFGICPEKIKRLFYVWTAPGQQIAEQIAGVFRNETGFHVELLGFRDTILQPLFADFTTTAYYEDNLHRTLSLVKYWQHQA